MPAVLNPDTKITKKQKEISRFYKTKNDPYSFAVNNFMHTMVPAVSFDHVRPSIVSSMALHNSKKFVVYLSKFNALCDLEQDYEYNELKSKFTDVLFELMSFINSDLSFSLTNENSVFFTFKSGDYEVHLNYFFDFDENDIDDDEIVFTYYEKNIKKESFGGRLKDILSTLKSILNEETVFQVMYFSQKI
ncbi:hypothetical protein BWZ20_08700 [Winogradskyella sp. J14-2]|uniref:hypothetical protein n=1 Tax=Winogradskyella sp. J14-2 TaxID=1936080 RepID=UPI000972BF4C|nr:hypothetical protein [Winogradskyella sp. J14-2]APY08372.1 hypothetical protein BWZ20_08700 [Winogradskyella sp. J14-2]